MAKEKEDNMEQEAEVNLELLNSLKQKLESQN